MKTNKKNEIFIFGGLFFKHLRGKAYTEICEKDNIFFTYFQCLICLECFVKVWDRNSQKYRCRLYIFDIFANFGPKFESISLIFFANYDPKLSGNIQDISNTENKRIFFYLFRIFRYMPPPWGPCLKFAVCGQKCNNLDNIIVIFFIHFSTIQQVTTINYIFTTNKIFALRCSTPEFTKEIEIRFFFLLKRTLIC